MSFCVFGRTDFRNALIDILEKESNLYDNMVAEIKNQRINNL